MVISLAACSDSRDSVQTEVSASMAQSESPQKTDVVAEVSVAEENLSFDITDLAGNTVHFEKPIEKAYINVPGGAFFTMCGLFGREVSDHIACWDNGLKNWPDFYEQFNAKMPSLRSIPIVGGVYADKLNVEAVIASGAEVAIFPLMNYNFKGVSDTLVPQLEAAGIQVICTDFYSETLESTKQSIEIIGQLFGEKARAKEISDFFESQVSDIFSRVDVLLQQGAERPVIYIEYGGKGPDEYGPSYSNNVTWGSISHMVGGTSLYADSDTNYPKVDPEFLLKSDPDIIVIVGGNWGTPESMVTGFDATKESIAKTLEAYCARPGWDALTAVKERRVYIICNTLSRNIFSFSCYQHLAKAVWPDEFDDIDANATLKEYFDRFMPLELSGVWFYDMQ